MRKLILLTMWTVLGFMFWTVLLVLIGQALATMTTY